MLKTKLIFMGLFTIFMLIAIPVNAASIKINIDGQNVTYSQPAIVKDNRTLVPLRGIFEDLGADVKWDQKTKTVNAVRGNTNVKLTIGSKNAMVNGQAKALEVPAQVINNSTLVPLRFISESLGASVGWDAGSKTITIETSTTSSDLCGDPVECSELGDMYLEKLASASDRFMLDIGVESSEDFEDGFSTDAHELISYSVNGDEISNPELWDDITSEEYLSLQNDTELHQDIWYWISEIIPMHARDNVSDVMLFTDDETLGWVYPDDELQTWLLSMNLSQVEQQEQFLITLVHEVAHLLTLNHEEINSNISEENCSTYYVEDYGCTNEDSYMNIFYDAYWADFYHEWEEVKDNEESQYEFYEEYSDQFVSHYASTQLAEDLAETIMYFVFTYTPDGDTVAEDKVLYFHNDEYMSQLRVEILKNLVEFYEID